MSNPVDLTELALDRSDTGALRHRSRQRLLTRYLLPSLLIVGFALLLAWAVRDTVFPPTPVTVVPLYATVNEARREGTPLFQAAGWIEPRPTPVKVAALAPGVVDKLLVVEDQRVTAGQPIAELVKDDALLASDRATADLALRQAELEEARSDLTAAVTRFQRPVHLEAELGAAEAALANTETTLKNLPFQIRRAAADYSGLRTDYEGKLLAKGVVAGVAIDIAASKAAAAQAFLEELRNRSDSLHKANSALIERRNAIKTQLELLADETKAKDAAEAKVRAATARVAQAGVAVAEAKLRLDRMTIVAPFDGRVYRLIGHPGTHLASGSGSSLDADGRTVVTLYRPDWLQVRVDVRFEDLPKVSLGQPIEIDNPALPSPLTGKVLFISSEADIQKNTLEVKVKMPPAPEVIKPEMLVDVTFLSPKSRSSPEQAVQEMQLFTLRQLIHQDGSDPFVWLADQSDGVARKRLVKLGESTANGLVQVTDGLTISARIISEGADGLQDGDRITVISEDPMLGTAPSSPEAQPTDRQSSGDHP